MSLSESFSFHDKHGLMKVFNFLYYETPTHFYEFERGGLKSFFEKGYFTHFLSIFATSTTRQE